MSKDIRLAYIVDEVYKSLVAMCQMNGSDLSEVIRELAAKQQLIDIRSAVSARPRVCISCTGDVKYPHEIATPCSICGYGATPLGQGGACGVMSNDHSDNIVMDEGHGKRAEVAN